MTSQSCWAKSMEPAIGREMERATTIARFPLGSGKGRVCQACIHYRRFASADSKLRGRNRC